MKDKKVFAEFIRNYLGESGKASAKDFKENVAEFIKNCIMEEKGLPMFRTRYAGKRFPSNLVLGICWGGAGYIQSKGWWFSNVPKEDLEYMEKHTGDWRYLWEKYGSGELKLTTSLKKEWVEKRLPKIAEKSGDGKEEAEKVEKKECKTIYRVEKFHVGLQESTNVFKDDKLLLWEEIPDVIKEELPKLPTEGTFELCLEDILKERRSIGDNNGNGNNGSNKNKQMKRPKFNVKHYAATEIYNIEELKKSILTTMKSFKPEDIYREESGQYEMCVDIIASNVFGRYMNDIIASHFGLKLPEWEESWAEYEFANEDIATAAEEIEKELNEKIDLPGTLYFGDTETGDYCLIYIWEKGEHPEWESKAEK